MIHVTDFEKPIDWLAARGLTSRLNDDRDCYQEFSVSKLKKLAKGYKKASGKSYHECLNEICIALGYDGFANYQDFMKRRGEYQTSADRMAKKTAKKAAKNSAKKQAMAYSAKAEQAAKKRGGFLSMICDYRLPLVIGQLYAFLIDQDVKDYLDESLGVEKAQQFHELTLEIVRSFYDQGEKARGLKNG